LSVVPLNNSGVRNLEISLVTLDINADNPSALERNARPAAQLAALKLWEVNIP
jgi:hypothetical protein